MQKYKRCRITSCDRYFAPPPEHPNAKLCDICTSTGIEKRRKSYMNKSFIKRSPRENSSYKDLKF